MKHYEQPEDDKERQFEAWRAEIRKFLQDLALEEDGLGPDEPCPLCGWSTATRDSQEFAEMFERLSQKFSDPIHHVICLMDHLEQQHPLYRQYPE
jgi:hypothetical protein